MQLEGVHVDATSLRPSRTETGRTGDVVASAA